MKYTLITLKVFSVVVTGLLISLLVWANMAKPRLSEQFNLEPIAFAFYGITQPISNETVQQLEQHFRMFSKISTISVNTKDQLVAISYPVEFKRQLKQAVLKSPTPLVQKKLDLYKGPTCPIPHNFIANLHSIKKIFCFRK